MLCLALGALEQHGPHLPLNTDLLIAEAVTAALLERFGDAFDMWQLPSLAIGLSPEHAWAPGTLTFSVDGFNGYMRDLARSVTHSLPARKLLLVNGHGGNRGILQALLYELQDDFQLEICVLHPLALVREHIPSSVPEIHGGKDETSLMLAIAPATVRTDLITRAPAAPDLDAIKKIVTDAGTTWAWRSNDARIALDGVTGDPRAASAAFGHEILARIVEAAEPVLRRLATGA